MLKITLLNMLFHEFDAVLVKEGKYSDRAERSYRIINRTYPDIPEIQSVTMEERYLPRSVLYYIWVNDENKAADLTDRNLCRWIISFAREYCPDYLKKDLPDHPIESGISILDCFEVDKIPSYRKGGAYSDLTVTTMEDVKNNRVEKDTRQATFPGLRFAKNHRK